MTVEDKVKGEIPVICDNKTCPERGDRPRCYLDIYKLCDVYIVYTKDIKSADSQLGMKDTLSDKMDDKQSKCEHCGSCFCTYEETYFKLKDVKEFIKRLKDFVLNSHNTYDVIGRSVIADEIDILAGEKLT